MGNNSPDIESLTVLENIERRNALAVIRQLARQLDEAEAEANLIRSQEKL